MFYRDIAQIPLNKTSFLKALAKKKRKEKGSFLFFQINLTVICDENVFPEKDHFLLKGQNFKCHCVIILVNGILT